MREAFHVELEQLAEQLSTMCGVVGELLEQATTALFESDLTAAEAVMGRDEELDSMRLDTERVALKLLALQSPVATELRRVLAVFRMVSDLERMGDLAQHVAEAARRRHPEPVLTGEAKELFSGMAAEAINLAHQAQQAITELDGDAAPQLHERDEKVDEIHRKLFGLITDPNSGLTTRHAADVSLLSRFYERFADHAVALAQQVSFIVTGELPDPKVS